MTERRPLAIVNGEQREIPAGDVLPTSLVADPTGHGGALWTPTVVAAGESFRIPVDTQLMTVYPVKVDGHMIIDGHAILAEAGICCNTDAGGGPMPPPPPPPPPDDSGLVAAATEIAQYLINHPTPISLSGVSFPDIADAAGKRIAAYQIRWSGDVGTLTLPPSSTPIDDMLGAADRPPANAFDDRVITPRVGPFLRPGAGSWPYSDFQSVTFSGGSFSTIAGGLLTESNDILVLLLYGTDYATAESVGLDGFTGTVSGSTNDVAGATAAIRDYADGVFISGPGQSLVTVSGVRFKPIVNPLGRPINAFYIRVFATSTTSRFNTQVGVSAVSGLSVSPASMTDGRRIDGPSVPTYLGPFFKSVGHVGSWAQSELNNLRCSVSAGNLGTCTIQEVSLLAILG